MSLPGAVTLTEGSCGSSASSGECYTNQELLCFNPCYALTHEDACGNVTVTALRLEPEDSEVATGRRCAVRVVATFSNGREADVSQEAVIDTENDSVAAYLDRGLVRGVAAGSCWIEATWGGRTCRGTVTVATGSTATLDLVLVLDTMVLAELGSVNTRSDAGVDSYYLPTPVNYSEGLAYLARAAQGALAVTTALDPDEAGGDRVAIVATGPTGTLSVSGWSTSLVEVELAALQGGRVGKAVEAAETLLESARTTANKAVLVLTSGLEAACNPSLDSAAGSAVNAGAKLAIVSPVAADTTIEAACSSGTLLFSYLQGVTSQPCLCLGGAVNSTVAVKLHQAVRGFLGEGPCA